MRSFYQTEEVVSLIMVRAVVSVETLVMGWNGLFFCIFQHFSLCAQPLAKQGECQTTWISDFLLQDVSPPGCPLACPQLDGPLSGPVCGRCRIRHCGRSLDGEAVGATRLVYTQVVLLQQTACKLLAFRPPGQGRITHTNI